MRRVRLTLICALTASVASGRARAEPSSEQAAAADHLFQEALELMRAADYATACPKLQKSLELDPATGTRMNLAFCYEATGRTASAWAQFNAVASEAKRSSPPRPDRVKTAQEHADALAPKLSYITLVVPPAARTAGLKLTVDGAEWLAGEALPADPGTRVIEATAPGFQTYRTEATVDADHPRFSVTLPPLEHLPSAPPATSAEPAPAAHAPGEDGASSMRTVGYVAVGGGVAAIAVGSVFAALALGKNAESKACGAKPSCTDSAYPQANTLAWVADVAIPVGVLAAGVGALLVLTSPRARSVPQSSVTFAPRWGGGQLAWMRSW
jgi:hypothetical protein